MGIGQSPKEMRERLYRESTAREGGRIYGKYTAGADYDTLLYTGMQHSLDGRNDDGKIKKEALIPGKSDIQLVTYFDHDKQIYVDWIEENGKPVLEKEFFTSHKNDPQLLMAIARRSSNFHLLAAMNEMFPVPPHDIEINLKNRGAEGDSKSQTTLALVSTPLGNKFNPMEKWDDMQYRQMAQLRVWMWGRQKELQAIDKPSSYSFIPESEQARQTRLMMNPIVGGQYRQPPSEGDRKIYENEILKINLSDDGALELYESIIASEAAYKSIINNDRNVKPIRAKNDTREAKIARAKEAASVYIGR